MSVVDFIFLNFAFTMVVMGLLMNKCEAYLPDFVRQSFRYGKFGYTGPSSKFLNNLEYKKSNFRHFYIVASVLSTAAIYLVIQVYFYQFKVPTWLITYLDLMCGASRTPKFSALATLLSVFLLTVQCWRRFYETCFVQVFSKNAKINLSHYIVGHFHYIGCFTVILAFSHGFSTIQGDFQFYDWPTLLMALPAVFLFFTAWKNQFASNIILANLRKDDKSSTIVSQKYFLPKGGWFDHISCPHLLCEILIYIALTFLLFKSFSWLCVLTWVLSNQIDTALLSHKWYKKTFPKYPKDRKALVPYIL